MLDFENLTLSFFFFTFLKKLNMNKTICIDQGNGGIYEIPVNELFFISYRRGEKVYDWIMLLRQKEWFTNKKCVEFCYCMIAVADELDIIFDYEILERSLI
jgi:hypothetical protein